MLFAKATSVSANVILAFVVLYYILLYVKSINLFY